MSGIEEKKIVETWLRIENGKPIGFIYILDDGTQVLDGE